MELEHKLTISNLVFLAISQLNVYQLEMLKATHLSRGRIEPRKLVRIISVRMKCLPSLLFRDLESLGSMRLVHPHYNAKEDSRVLELTDTGRLIAEEVMREV